MRSLTSKTVLWNYPHFKYWMGGTKFLLEMAISLSPYSVSAEFLINNSDKQVLEKFTDHRIRVHKLSLLTSTSLLYWLFLPFFLVVEIFMSLRIVMRNKPNYLFSTLFPSNAIFAVLSVFLKIPYYYYCYEPFPFLQNKKFIATFPFYHKLLLNLLALLYRPLDSWATRKATKVFTLNYITAGMIEKTYGTKPVVTLMGVDSKHFSPHKSDIFTKKFQSSELIAHSTDYTSMKNTDLAIQIFHRVHKKHPRAVLLITSTRPNAPEKKSYEKLVSSLKLTGSVHFLDLVDYSLLPHLYSEAICYLSCSYDEMLGTTSSNLPVKESLACGTPAIRADITTEDVEDGISGYLIDPRKIDEVAAKIHYLIENPLKARKMGIRGRKRIVNAYTWDKVAKIISDEIHY